MKLIVVSNFLDVPGEHELLTALFREGLEYYHLRKRHYTREQMIAYIEKIPAEFHRRIIIHSYFELAAAYQLKGAHFTKETPMETHISRLKQEFGFDLSDKKWHKSFSLHSIRESMMEQYRYNYIFLSPIFDSISNIGYNSKFRVNDLRNFLLEGPDVRPPVIALSGITYEEVKKAYYIGFDGVALLGHIWTNFEAEQDLLRSIRRFTDIRDLIVQLPATFPQSKHTSMNG